MQIFLFVGVLAAPFLQIYKTFVDRKHILKFNILFISLHCRENSRLPFTFKKLLVYLKQRRKEIRLLIGQSRSQNENNNYQTF